ncbi:MAG: anti-sigma factor [Actinomycetota bacterium]|nr:anti-sigma factor [Actinomycetota bacterium]
MSPLEPSDVIFGELSEAERAEAERLMREDPEFRAQVERLRPTAERLAALPAEAWQKLEPPPPPPLADLKRPATPRRRRRRLVLRPAIAAGLACVLIAIGVGAALLLDSDQASVSGPSYGLEPVAAGAPGETGTVSLDDAEREVVIRVKGLPASAPDQFYEAWLLSGADRVVSLGAFRVDPSGEGELRAQLPDDPRSYRFFDVSLETADGDPTHSGRSVLRASTS